MDPATAISNAAAASCYSLPPARSQPQGAGESPHPKIPAGIGAEPGNLELQEPPCHCTHSLGQGQGWELTVKPWRFLISHSPLPWAQKELLNSALPPQNSMILPRGEELPALEGVTWSKRVKVDKRRTGMNHCRVSQSPACWLGFCFFFFAGFTISNSGSSIKRHQWNELCMAMELQGGFLPACRSGEVKWVCCDLCPGGFLTLGSLEYRHKAQRARLLPHRLHSILKAKQKG